MLKSKFKTAVIYCPNFRRSCRFIIQMSFNTVLRVTQDNSFTQARIGVRELDVLRVMKEMRKRRYNFSDKLLDINFKSIKQMKQ